MRPFHLLVLPAAGPIRYVALGDAALRIGASAECEVHVADPELAPVHARIEPRDGGFVLVRVSLPLLLNGLRAKAQVLAPHDLLVMGKNAIAFRPGAPPSEGHGAVRVEPMRRLHAFAERVRKGEDAGALAEHLVADLLALTDASRGTVVRFTQDDDPVRIATSTQGSFSGGEVAISHTLLARMRETASAIFVASTATDPRFSGAESLAGPSFSAIAVPVAHEGRVLGAVYVSGREGTLVAEHVELMEVYASIVAGLLETERRATALAAQVGALGDNDDDPTSLLIGSSAPMGELRRTIGKIAASKAPILVLGETGTGKELVAREVHRMSPRAREPFVAVNCGAIPPELLASELFGHKKGAFTQAHQDRPGYFRSADGGTLFLDEIGEMPLLQQVALLRVLQEGRVTPVGADTSVPVDVRIIGATNRSIADDVAQGRFRQDLYFRIAVVTLKVSPLRERAGDIVRLAAHFLRIHVHELRLSTLRFSDDALEALVRERWDGNVRELEAAVRRAVLLREGPELTRHDLGLAAALPPVTATRTVRPLAMARDEFLRDYVRDAVTRCGGNRTAAADALLVTPRTVFKYLEE